MLFEPTGIPISLKNSIRREKTIFFSGTMQPKYLTAVSELPIALDEMGKHFVNNWCREENKD